MRRICLLFLIISITLLDSCSKKNEEVKVNKANNNVAEIYKSNLKEKSNKYSQNWDEARIMKLDSTKETIIIPVTFDKGYRPSIDIRYEDELKDVTKAKKLDQDAIVYQLITLDKSFIIHNNLMIVFPDDKKFKNQKIDGTTFSGVVLYTDLELTKVNRIEKWKDGKIDIKRNNSRNGRAKVLQQVCTDYYYQVCVNGNCTDPVYSYSDCGLAESEDNYSGGSTVLVITSAGGGGGSTSPQDQIQDLNAQLRQLEEPQVTARENAILNSIGILAHIQYRVNAIEAAGRSRIKFGQGSNACQDNSCNAFKHAFFSALNAYTFSPTVSQLLGEAREGMTLQTVDCVTQPANYMDLVNNQVGYTMIWDAYKANLPADYNTNAANKAYYMATHNQLQTLPVNCP